ncbi:MAG: hypothetical protein ACOCUV_02040, partial [bacterium]
MKRNKKSIVSEILGPGLSYFVSSWQKRYQPNSLKSTLLIILVSFLPFLAHSSSVQDYSVYLDGKNIKVKGTFDRKIHYTSDNPADAIQYALDQVSK